MKTIVRLFVCTFLFAMLGCSSNKNDMELVAELQAVDSSFSDMSEKMGTLKAFHSYMAPDGKTIPKQGQPVGRDRYSELLAQQPSDRTSTLTWKPLFADVASSGDLGYTYGQYQLTFVDSTKTAQYGYYVTIWKKQADGSWKFVMDLGNESDAPANQ